MIQSKPESIRCISFHRQSQKNIQDKIYLEVESRISLISFVDITK